MSPKPVTPSKMAGVHQLPVSLEEHIDQMARLSIKGDGQESNEPSPASTYGDTAVGESAPATPLYDKVIDDADLGLHLKSDDGTTSHHTNKTLQFISKARQATPPVSSISNVHHSFSNVRVAGYTSNSHLLGRNSESSPARLTGMVAEQDSNGPFVLQDAGALIEDPFVSQNLAEPYTSPRHCQHGEQYSQDESAQDIATTIQVPTPGAEIGPKSASLFRTLFAPRADRVGQPVSSKNAQALNPPEACIFVANLPSTKSDEELQYAIEAAFKGYGICWVKVRRDRRGMPFAFVQYTMEADAHNAILNGRKHFILGRQCRTETARAQRALYVSRKDGNDLNENEVRAAFQNCGPVEKVFAPSETDMEKHRLPQGLWVRFAFWEDCRDALKSLRNDPVYHLEQEDKPGRMSVFSPKKSCDRHPVPTTMYRMHYDPFIHDSRALFLGHLPSAISRTEIEDVFRIYGPLQAITINTRHSAGRLNSHAIVMFHSPVAAAAALEGEQGRLMLADNTLVRIEYALVRRAGLCGSPSRFNRHPGAPGLLGVTPNCPSGYNSYIQQAGVHSSFAGAFQPQFFLGREPVSENDHFRNMLHTSESMPSGAAAPIHNTALDFRTHGPMFWNARDFSVAPNMPSGQSDQQTSFNGHTNTTNGGLFSGDGMMRPDYNQLHFAPTPPGGTLNTESAMLARDITNNVHS